MKSKNFKIPFIEMATIKRKADLFRQKFWDEKVPVNVEEILDLKLGLFIIPVPKLQKMCDTDALITSNWHEIYVDKEMYMDERYNNRLRFSYAHEIGHLILHKELYANLDINSYEDFYKFNLDIPREEYNAIETQANIFASFLIIPREKLSISRQNSLNEYINKGAFNAEKIEREMLNSYLAIPMAKQFGVSEEAMKNALNNEDKGKY